MKNKKILVAVIAVIIAILCINGYFTYPDNWTLPTLFFVAGEGICAFVWFVILSSDK